MSKPKDYITTSLMNKALLTGAILCAALWGTVPDAQAKVPGIDPTPYIRPVDGHVVNHGGFIVSPTPQRMALDKAGRLDISAGVNIKDRKKRFAKELNFLKQNPDGPKIDIDFGAKKAAREGVKPQSGAYAMTIDREGITVTAYDERGAFYAIQTIRQLAESPAAAGCILPYAQINDWPDIPSRGVVEGFYGTPWSHQTRLSILKFCGEYKMNTYVYGPKDDPYHRTPHWRDPYPEQEAQRIKELVATAREARVDFTWAVHPGQDIQWNDDDYRALTAKFEHMYTLGVRAFAIFFDDISGQGTDPARQVALLNRLQDEFVNRKGDVAPLIVCPTDYTKAWANPSEDGALSVYGRTLHPDIHVFWTGDLVCSDLTRQTLQWVNSRIQRPASFWWNFPVTDYARNILMQGPAYGMDPNLTKADLHALLSNPMEHGQASKIALYGVADYAWNTGAYNALDNWDRALSMVAPRAKQAYATFARHSCDTRKGFRRDESWGTDTFSLENWDEDLASKLREEFARMEKDAASITPDMLIPGLYEEVHPWLEQCARLGTRGKKAIDLGRMYRAGVDDNQFWNAYAANLLSSADSAQYAAHSVGVLKMQPFCTDLMADMGKGFMARALANAGITPHHTPADSLTPDITGLRLHADDTRAALRTIDQNVQTVYYLKGRLSLDIPQGKQGCVILTHRHEGTESIIHINIIGADGIILRQDGTKPYTRLHLPEGARRIDIKGDAVINEIIVW